MNSPYRIDGVEDLLSPSLVFFKDLIRQNLARVLAMVGGDPSRLRPHVKTHKTREIVRMQLDAGVRKHKCATVAEAEMLASCGVPDVLLAYPLVGPNVARLAALASTYPQTRFAVSADDAAMLERLSAAVSAFGQTVDVLVDIDMGQHRTGMPAGPNAAALYAKIAALPGLAPGGLHAYDGHHQHEAYADREGAALGQLEPVLALRASLEKQGLPVPRVVAGGTPTFPVYAKLDVPGLECSPGTFILYDKGYGAKFADLAGLVPAAVLLTRVVSRPTPTRVTFDLGTKAVASDPPAGKRCHLLGVEDYTPVVHNEEHFVVETPHADRFRPGMEVLALPTHVCPTCAWHAWAYVVEGGKVVGKWDIAARDRVLTV